MSDKETSYYPLNSLVKDLKKSITQKDLLINELDLVVNKLLSGLYFESDIPLDIKDLLKRVEDNK